MNDKYRKLIIRLGLFLIALTVISFFLIMFHNVLRGQGAVPVAPNPTAKGGSAFPVAAIIFGAALFIVLLYGLVLRLINWLSQKHGAKFKVRHKTKDPTN